MGAAVDVARFALAAVFIILGAGLALEGFIGALTNARLFIFLDGVNRSLEFFVGLMGLTLGGLLIGGMSRVPERERKSPP